MGEDSLDAAYRRVLEESRRRGEVVEDGPGMERRSNPRIRVNPGDLPAELDPWVFAIDISISGMAIYAEEPAEPGHTVDLDMAGLTTQAEVVACHEEPAGGPDHPGRYRLHCRFKDEEEGMRLLVRIKELEEGAHPPSA